LLLWSCYAERAMFLRVQEIGEIADSVTQALASNDVNDAYQRISSFSSEPISPTLPAPEPKEVVSDL